MRLLCGEWENVRERFHTWLWFVYRLFPNDHQWSWKNSWWPGLPVDLCDQVSAAAQNAIGNLEQTHKGAATFRYCFWHLVIVFFLVLTLSILQHINAWHQIKLVSTFGFVCIEHILYAMLWELSGNKWNNEETPDLSFSIRPASLCACHADQVGGGLEPLPACIGREAGCTLDGTPVYHITQIGLKNLSELNGIIILSTLIYANEEKCRSSHLACLPSYIN